ncbi:putative DnaJ domain, Chaperone J-domain superfamily [Helianthus annuus]|nr:putative DnaJ domain, Chaperone J-domain superfamily [Helianthus annuus]
MGEYSGKSKKKKRRYSEDSTSSSSPSSSSSISTSETDDESSSKRHKSSRKHRRRRSSERGSSRREKEKRREKRKKKKREKDRKRGSSNRRSKPRVSDSDSEEEKEYGLNDGGSDPVDVVKFILEEFPAVADDLEQLLRMIDDGQAVDISGLSEKSLVKYLKKLFLSLNLNEKGNLVFLLPSGVPPTLEVVGSVISKSKSQGPSVNDNHEPPNNLHTEQPNEERKLDDGGSNPTYAQDDMPAPKKRVIGPAMPSAELLAAAAKLTEAEAELREAEIGEDDELFIGPPPPAVVNEAASANDAERFEEVTRIMGAEIDNPYDVVGVNRNMAADSIKKRYWKLSLMVHPDKCPHPEAHQAFIKLNKAFKDLQDPVKRKAMDDKIDEKEEKERFKLELKAMREAAQWRRLQGISMEGDEALLADLDVKEEKKRDEWMTTLPPERKPGVATQQSTKSFSRTSREGRGDTSAWTDTPLDRAQKAKTNYLEAYNEAAALAANDQEKKTSNADAELVDQYNKAKRSKSLVEKHQESTRVRSKKKSKTDKEKQKEEWEGQHPWKPWDREKDLTGGRQNVKLDAENMAQGLTSRFSSGSFQRNFL